MSAEPLNLDTLLFSEPPRTMSEIGPMTLSDLDTFMRRFMEYHRGQSE